MKLTIAESISQKAILLFRKNKKKNVKRVPIEKYDRARGECLHIIISRGACLYK